MYALVPEIIALFSGLPRLQLLLFIVEGYSIQHRVSVISSQKQVIVGGYFLSPTVILQVIKNWRQDTLEETRLDRNHPLYIFTAQQCSKCCVADLALAQDILCISMIICCIDLQNV